MRKNKVKAKLLAGEAAIGCSLLGNWPEAVEMVGLLGADYIYLDGEHGTLSIPEIANLVHVAKSVDITPLARVPCNTADVISRYLDLGIQGIIVPNVNTREDAERAVRATKYSPEGERGLGACHASDYGIDLSWADYVEMANKETMVLILCESKEGVDNLEEIVRVAGIDVVMIGFLDLSLSLGIPGQLDNPLEQEAMARARKIALAAGKVVGLVGWNGDHARELISENVRFITVGAHEFIKSGLREYLAKARASS